MNWRGMFGDDCCKIPISLIDTKEGEGKAHACDMAWFRQLLPVCPLTTKMA